MPVLLFLASCAGDSWEKYDSSLYANFKYATPEAMAEHLELLEEIVTEADEKGRPPPPGIMAEYGFFLMQKGESKEGASLMNREIETYPEAEKFVTAIKRLASGEAAIPPESSEKGAGP